MKTRKLTIIIVLLIAWAVFSLLFIANDNWQDFKNEKIKQSYDTGFQEGLNEGYKQAVLQFAQMAQNCEEVPLNLGNDQEGNPQTMIIKRVDCQDKSQENPAE